jgi:hypothetical protein
VAGSAQGEAHPAHLPLHQPAVPRARILGQRRGDARRRDRIESQQHRSTSAAAASPAQLVEAREPAAGVDPSGQRHAARRVVATARLPLSQRLDLREVVVAPH